MKCDLHIHTTHSGPCHVPVVNQWCKESYNPAQAAYRKLKQSGMGLVTITDHDSIDAAEELRQHPDFFVSEEVTCVAPSGNQFHMGVYDIQDRDHLELQRRRNDFWSLMAYLREHQLFYSINHPFSSLTGQRSRLDFMLFEDLFPAVEVRNGHMLRAANELAVEFTARTGKIAIGGSDAHAMVSVGCAYTEVPGARSKDEFFAGLRAGRSRVGGGHGNYLKLTREVLTIAAHLFQEHPWLAPMAICVPLIPVITLVNYSNERNFAAYWRRRLEEILPAPQPAAEKSEAELMEVAG